MRGIQQKTLLLLPHKSIQFLRSIFTSRTRSMTSFPTEFQSFDTNFSCINFSINLNKLYIFIKKPKKDDIEDWINKEFQNIAHFDIKRLFTDEVSEFMGVFEN